VSWSILDFALSQNICDQESWCGYLDHAQSLQQEHQANHNVGHQDCLNGWPHAQDNSMLVISRCCHLVIEVILVFHVVLVVFDDHSKLLIHVFVAVSVSSLRHHVLLVCRNNLNDTQGKEGRRSYDHSNTTQGKPPRLSPQSVHCGLESIPKLVVHDSLSMTKQFNITLQ